MRNKKIPPGLVICGALTILFPLRLYFDLTGIVLAAIIPLQELPGYIFKYFLLRPGAIALQFGCLILAAGMLKAKRWAVNGCLAMNWCAVFLGTVTLFLPNLPIPLAGKIELMSVGTFLIWYLQK